MSRIIRFLVPVLALLLLFSACSSSRGNPAISDEDYSGPPGSENSYPDNDLRQVIYEIYLSLEVDDVEKSIDALGKRAVDLGGYISASNHYASHPSAEITFRIPQANYPKFLAFARELGEPGRETVNSTDVTEEFVDLEARLANRLAHEERLLQMIEQTARIEELLEVERELARIREDIEVIQGRLRYLEERTAMAKIEIHLTQLAGETDIPGLGPMGIRETLRRSLKALINSSTLFLDFLSYLAIAVAAVLPFAIPFAVITIIIVRGRRKKKAKESNSHS